MPQFKRFVAYLYYYENDTKEYLAGFARVEMRGGICRLEIHLKGTEYAGQEGKVSLFIRREGKILAFPVGNMRLMSQSSDYSGRISDGELGDETCHIQDVCGILIQPADGNFYGSQWDNGEIHKEEIEMQAGEKEASIWEHWENLKQKMTLLHPFEGENITCVHMELQDLRELPQKYWCLGNNSFLLHGFFNYRYLFFGEEVTPEGRELFLAVPGVYQKPEKVMAAIFGFPQFRTEKPCRQLEGTFGYWYRRMDG